MPFLAAAVALALAAGDAPRTWGVVAGSTLSYRLVHKLHEVEGVCRTVEGKARLLPDGQLQVAVRARVECFDSGNGNRDAHMREATEAARFPLVTLKAVGRGPAAGDPLPQALDVVLAGELTLHGVARPVEVPVKVSFDGARAQARAAFPVSLEAHQVERPSLLFVKVEDQLRVTAELALELER